MKKIYALMAAASLCAASASAFNFAAAPRVLNEKNEVDASSIKIEKINSCFTPKTTMSRADEAQWDPANATCALYHSYQNYFDEEGNQCEFQGYVSGEQVEIVDTVIESKPEIIAAVKSIWGYGFMNPIEIGFNETDGLYMNLGTQILQMAGGTPVIIGAFVYTTDPATGKVSTELKTEGTIPMKAYVNGLGIDDNEEYMIAAFNSANNKFFRDISAMHLSFLMPNATLKYNVIDTDEEGNPIGKTPYEGRVYTEIFEPEFDSKTNEQINEGGVMVSWVNPTNSGIAVKMEDLGIGGLVAIDAVTNYSQPISETQGTGKFLLTGFGEHNGQTAYDTNVFIDFNVETNTITWPVKNDMTTLEMTTWASMAESGYWFGECEPATLVLDSDVSSVGSVVVDNNENAPVEYYNLQGVKVLNPTAGQVIIKKQGNKTSKFIAP